MLPRLMISISGVRGVYGDGLDDECAEKFAFAFGTIYGGTIVVGRDSRISGGALSRAVISGLRKAGADAIDIGLASTPTTEMAVIKQNASGGMIITASHNPGEWNGLKFLGPDGVFLDATQGAELLEKFRLAENISELPLRGAVSTWDGGNEHH
ncbi:MAG: phosphoglucosamine mutase, partial [Candidatus Latescibacteria bacterium]|nr:phosphoglucosamine mutase [Candidatus Latescibacterota bacterium]